MYSLLRNFYFISNYYLLKFVSLEICNNKGKLLVDKQKVIYRSYYFHNITNINPFCKEKSHIGLVVKIPFNKISFRCRTKDLNKLRLQSIYLVKNDAKRKCNSWLTLTDKLFDDAYFKLFPHLHTC